MYKTRKRVSLESLGKEITYDDDKIAVIRTDGVVYEILKDNMLEGTWPGLPVNDILQAVEGHGIRRIEIPEEVARHIETYAKPELEKIESSFTDWNNFKVRFFPAEGARSWDDTRVGLVGDKVSTGNERDIISDRKLDERVCVWMRIKCRYALF